MRYPYKEKIRPAAPGRRSEETQYGTRGTVGPAEVCQDRRHAAGGGRRLLAQSGFEDLGYARVDHSRARRQGAAEVIFGQGKTAEQIEGIVQSMIGRGTGNIIITRLSEEKEAALRGKFPYRYSQEAHLAVANRLERPLRGSIAVVSAGTSDLAVCEEAALTAEALGSKVHRVLRRRSGGAPPPPGGAGHPGARPVRGGGGGYGGRPPQRGGGAWCPAR